MKKAVNQALKSMKPAPLYADEAALINFQNDGDRSNGISGKMSETTNTSEEDVEPIAAATQEALTPLSKTWNWVPPRNKAGPGGENRDDDEIIEVIKGQLLTSEVGIL